MVLWLRSSRVGRDVVLQPAPFPLREGGVWAQDYVNVAMRARDQCTIFSTGGKFALTMGFYWSYTLLL